MRQLIIAFTDQDVAGKIKHVLAGHGLPVAGICSSAAQVLQLATLLESGGVVICPYRLVDMTARELLNLLSDEYDMLVLATPRQQVQINEPGIYSLAQPVNGPALLDSARQLLETRQIRLDRLFQANRPSSSAAPRPAGQVSGSQTGRAPVQAGEPEPTSMSSRTLSEQKIIEQAKHRLMSQHQMQEDEAHRYLQRKSMESGIRLAELARRLILENESHGDNGGREPR